jgi:ABC-type Mn2+/Zn2+ transport system permease subunit
MEEKKFDTLMLFQMIFATLVMLIGIYIKVTVNDNLLPLMLILMSVMFLIIGLREYKKIRIYYGVSSICALRYSFYSLRLKAL